MEKVIIVILVIETLIIWSVLYRMTSDYYNPVGIMAAVSNFCSILALMELSSIQTTYSAMFGLVVMTYPVALTIGSFFVYRKKLPPSLETDFKKYQFSSCYILLTRCIFCLCVICTLLEWREQGFATLVTYDGFGDAKEIVGHMPGVHYGTVFLPYCAICSIFELIYRVNKTKKSILFNIVVIIYTCFHSFFILISRGTLLVIFMGMLYLLSRKYRIDLLKLIGILGLVLVTFYIIAESRITSASLVFNNIPEKPFESAIYSYTAINYENLNKLIHNGANYYFFGRTLNGFWQLLGVSDLFNIDAPIQTYFFNATPLVYDFYDDLGLVGVMIYGTIFGAYLSVIHKKARKSIVHVLFYAGLQKAIWMSFFGNYFTAFRIEIVPYIILYIISASLDSKRITFKRN